jgi:hypothetical protein
LAACTSGVNGSAGDGSDKASTETGFVAHERGLDYGWSRPSASTLKKAGFTFVARYLSYDNTGKNLTAGEAQGLTAGGVDIVSNWEWGAQDALDGYNKGRQEAQDALNQATAAGMPADRPIYFSVDFDASPGQQAAINDYFDGVASVLGVDRTGVYGGYWVVSRLFDAGKVKYGWQTEAWSGGQWDARAQLRQIANEVMAAGIQCDINESEADDFGQWGPNKAPTTSGPTPAEGGQAFLVPNEQHFLTTTAAGDLRHSWWQASDNMIHHDTWVTGGVAGSPVAFTYGGTDQHAFVRGADGSLQHHFWSPSGGMSHGNWATGLAADPAAIVIGPFQDVWAADGGNNLQHWWWSPNSNGVQHDTWGGGITGRPSVMLFGPQQHVFARGTGGSLEHFWWDPTAGIQHDTWAQSGLASDPSALTIGNFQDVWAVDTAGALQHWWWGPSTGGVQHDTWAQSGLTGRPSVMLANAQQNVFVRGTNGNLEHYFWTPTSNGIVHDTWGQGIAADPTAIMIGEQQHVWAPDASGVIQHFFYDPMTNMIKQDNWQQ